MKNYVYNLCYNHRRGKLSLVGRGVRMKVEVNTTMIMVE